VADDMNIKHHATCHPIKWFRVKQNFGRREAFTNGTKLNTNVAEISNSFKIFISAINAQNNTKHIHASPRFITEAFLKKMDDFQVLFVYLPRGGAAASLGGPCSAGSPCIKNSLSLNVERSSHPS